MRIRHVLLALTLAACSAGTVTSSLDDAEIASIVPDYANSAAAMIDPAGVGGAQFPAELALTTEQKAAIEALHAAFKTATAADVAALEAIQARARAAKQSGKGENDIRAILAEAAPILARMNTAFATLQAAILAVYTPEQRAWLASHQPRPCGPEGPPRLTDAQMQQIHALQEAFTHATLADVALIRQTADAAHHAAESGATRDATNLILHQADAAIARVRAAEQQLQHDLDAVLTPEQRAARCQAPGGQQPPPLPRS